MLTFDGSGRRHSAADLLNYANPVNIRVAVYASVERRLLESTSLRDLGYLRGGLPGGRLCIATQ